MLRWMRPDPERREEGAFAILFAVVVVMVFAVTALAVDLATFYQRKQQMVNTNDAAALAGAMKLPNMTAAQAAVTSSVAANFPGLAPPAAVFYCVVASTSQGGSYVPDSRQVGAGKLCDPGGTGYPATCNETTCSLPCVSATCKPNAIQVGQNLDVGFMFAPIIGIDSGQSNVVSVACRGTCGQAGKNAMDVVVIADRTSSMSADLATETAAIKNMLAAMEPSIQRVALSAVGWSNPGSCRITPYPSSSKPGTGTNVGAWIPVGLKDDFGGVNGLNTSSQLVASLNCMTSTSGTGTWLASPLRVAARYLLGMETGISGTALNPDATKAIIFETDGGPNETTITGQSTVSATNPLGTSANVGNSTATTACSNFTLVANAAKLAGVLLAFVDYGAGGSTACNLSSLASVDANGTSMYYKAASAADLNQIYQTALGAISGRSRLIALPS